MYLINGKINEYLGLGGRSALVITVVSPDSKNIKSKNYQTHTSITYIHYLQSQVARKFHQGDFLLALLANGACVV